MPNEHDIDPVTSECRDAGITRRRLIETSSIAATWAMMPQSAHALGGRDPRFLCVVLRGALDGLAAVPPVGDPEYDPLRGAFALHGEAILPLDDLFALNRHLLTLSSLYAAGDALIIHAAATPYRNRSHFDGQDVLESGLAGPGGATGWLNRALQVLPTAGRAKPVQGLSIGASAPLIMRGDATTLSWQSQHMTGMSDDTASRILGLYQDRDPRLAQALEASFALDEVGNRGTVGRQRQSFAEDMAATARFLGDPEGPRIAAVSSDGWDTHARANPTSGRLARLLQELDAGIAALRAGLGPVWQDTVVAFVTEFGRTAAINGTGGTDHGSGTVAFLVGGAVKGGRVLTDWPGLQSKDLLDQRDLMPTIDLRSVLKGVLADQFEIPDKLLANDIFPESHRAPTMRDLVA